MKIRLPAGGIWGRHLVIGVLVFVAMTLLLATIADEVVKGEPLTIIDAQLSSWINANRTASLVTFFKLITLLGSTLIATLLSCIVGIYLLVRGQRYWFTTFVLSVVGGVVLNRLLKSVFQRTRPQFDDPIMTFTGYSFPSGHTITATVLYGCLAALIVAHTRNQAVRVAVIGAAAVVIALVGFSRIYLGAHFLSDVLAAMAEGLAWLSLSFTLVYSLWRQKTVNGKSSARTGR